MFLRRAMILLADSHDVSLVENIIVKITSAAVEGLRRKHVYSLYQ